MSHNGTLVQIGSASLGFWNSLSKRCYACRYFAGKANMSRCLYFQPKLPVTFYRNLPSDSFDKIRLPSSYEHEHEIFLSLCFNLLCHSWASTILFELRNAISHSWNLRECKASSWPISTFSPYVFNFGTDSLDVCFTSVQTLSLCGSNQPTLMHDSWPS